MPSAQCFVSEAVLANHISVLNHPPYSPDLVPCDFSPTIKSVLNGMRFETVEATEDMDGRTDDLKHGCAYWKIRIELCRH